MIIDQHCFPKLPWRCLCAMPFQEAMQIWISLNLGSNELTEAVCRTPWHWITSTWIGKDRGKRRGPISAAILLLKSWKYSNPQQLQPLMFWQIIPVNMPICVRTGMKSCTTVNKPVISRVCRVADTALYSLGPCIWSSLNRPLNSCLKQLLFCKDYMTKLNLGNK